VADLYSTLNAARLIELYKASSGDPEMREVLREMVAQIPKNEQADNTIRAEGLKTARWMGLGVAGISMVLLATGQVEAGLIFGGIDLVAMITSFIPTGILKGIRGRR